MSDWYPWYPDRYRTSRRGRCLETMEQHGIYRLLLDDQWTDGGIPNDLDTIARLLPGACDRDAIAVVLETCFQLDAQSNTWREPVLEEIRREQIDKVRRRSAANSLAAKARWERRGSCENKEDNLRSQAVEKRKSLENNDLMHTHSERNANAMRNDAYKSKKKRSNPSTSPLYISPLLSPAINLRESDADEGPTPVLVNVDEFLDWAVMRSRYLTGDLDNARQRALAILDRLTSRDGHPDASSPDSYAKLLALFGGKPTKAAG